VYKKYIPTDEEHVISESMTNLATDGKYCGTTDNSSSNHTYANKYNLPISSSITLAPGSNSFTSSDGTNTPLQAKASVATLCFEPSGARLVAGHRDGTLRFYDFHGMQPSPDSETTFPPFKIVDSDNDPLDSTGRHIITALGASAGGGQWIVGSTSSQPRVLDREGRTTLFHFIKGDTYVTDSNNTKGHTAPVTGVAFHPLVKEICWTCGLDGSIRQWDLSGKGKFQFQKLVCQKVIGKCKNEKGQRTQIVSNLSVHPSGRKIVVGTACGSIQIWNCFGSGVNSRPLGAVHSAHGGSKPVTFVTFSWSGERIASRSESDDTVRIWDASVMEKGTGSFSRKFGSQEKEGKHPPSLLLATCNGLPALNESANCAFGPDGRLICAGTSVDTRSKNSSESCSGRIKFYVLPDVDKPSKISKETGSKASNNISAVTLDPIVELNVAPGASVLGVHWHPKLNQIAFGTSNGM
jgi:WD40 repeat protein